jgi:N-acetylglutamate synthase-like GNAT family acetyltransferase
MNGIYGDIYMPVKIRRFIPGDIESIVEILKENGQYSYPDVEGPEAMLRVAKCDAAVFLVAEIDSKTIGCVHAVYDGSRAIIHLLSIHPKYQHKGIGTNLVESVIKTLVERGAPTISVTVNDSSKGFWDQLGFAELPVFLMLKKIH